MDANPIQVERFPADWRTDRFDSLFDIVQGKQVSVKTRSGNNQQPFLRTKNVLWGRLDLRDVDEMHFTETEERRLELLTNDLLICEGGDVGRTAMWKGQLARCYYQNHLHRARLRDRAMGNAEFVMYWLWYAFEVANLYSGRSNSTTIPNLSQSRLGELPMPIPPLKEQRKIASVLSLAQKAIQQQDRLIELTTELKKALMQKLFTEGLDGEPQKQTELGPMPERWKLVRLGELFETQLGKMLSQKAHGGNEPKPYLRNKNVQWGYVHLSDMATMDFSDREMEKFRLLPGDLLVCEGGFVGRAALWRGDIEDCYYQKALHRLRPRGQKMSNEFLCYWLSFGFQQRNLYGIAGASSTIAHLPEVQLKALPIPLPQSTEQDEICSVLRAVDQSHETHKSRKSILSDLFRTLLHQFMTAQIRVNDLDVSELEGFMKE